MFIETVPAMHGEIHEYGYDGRYRLYTVDHLPFDALPSYGDGGPAKVVLDPWGTSTSSLCGFMSSPSVAAADDGMVTLNVYRVDSPASQPMVRHPLDGTRYATTRDADRAAYEAGVTAFMVYEREAARFGLPSEDGAA